MVANLNRLAGVQSSTALKAPVRAASTGPLTLSGIQTIDGVAFSSTDAQTLGAWATRILVKNQTDSSQNGLYDINTSAWTRCADWDAIDDFTTGSRVFVSSGATQSGQYVCTASMTTSFVVGVNAITFVAAATVDYANASFALVGLTFTSTSNAGLVLNDLTTTQQNALVSPSTGSLIYNTSTNLVTVFNGSSWVAVGITSLTIGTTPITSGTTTRILYDNAGVLGEYTITGSGTVVAMANSPVFTTPSIDAATATSVTASGLLQAGTTLGISTDVLLNRDAADTLSLQRSTNAQAFRIYNTFTSVSIYERFHIGWDGSNNFLIRSQAAGGGSKRDIYIDGNTVNFQINSNATWGVSTNGHFVAGVDNSFDIGASGANRPRNLYIVGIAEIGSLRIDASASAMGASAKTFTSAADSSTNIGHYFSISLSGTTYYVPCSTVQPNG